MVLFEISVILVCMGRGNGKVSKLVRLIRRFWYLFLSALFAISVTIFNIVNMYFDRFHIDGDSALYLLSALVQSQAAIVAIVVTLTLIAVQLAASSYSPRVIDIFKNDPTMWMLLSGYGVSIFFGLFVLEMIQDEDPSQIIFWSFHNFFISLELLIYLAYWLGLVTFAALFVYMKNVFDLLKPENIIKKLADNITKENILKFEEKQKEDQGNRTQPVKVDPVQPIVDIIRSSIMKYDYEIVKNGLEAITDRTIEIFDSTDPNKCPNEEYEIISSHFCYHLSLIGIFAVRNVNEIYIEVIRALKIFGVSMAEKGFEGAAAIAAESMLQFGTIAVQKGLDVTMQTAKSLAELINSSEYVSRTIEEYESELREEEIAAFQKIMKRCEQELEKLRAEVPQ